jgi:hypothetical protein
LVICGGPGPIDRGGIDYTSAMRRILSDCWPWIIIVLGLLALMAARVT